LPETLTVVFSVPAEPSSQVIGVSWLKKANAKLPLNLVFSITSALAPIEPAAIVTVTAIAAIMIVLIRIALSSFARPTAPIRDR
jgi:hypothetical protein